MSSGALPVVGPHGRRRSSGRMRPARRPAIRDGSPDRVPPGVARNVVFTASSGEGWAIFRKGTHHRRVPSSMLHAEHGRTPSPPSDGVLRPGVTAHQRSGGSAPDHRGRCAAEIVPCPQAPRRRKELDRRRLDRDDRGEEDEDQEQRNHHRETAPERGHDDRSEGALEADGCVHAGETPNPSILFRDSR